MNERLEADRDGRITLHGPGGFRASFQCEPRRRRRGLRDPVAEARWRRRQKRGLALAKTWIRLYARRASLAEITDILWDLVADGSVRHVSYVGDEAAFQHVPDAERYMTDFQRDIVRLWREGIPGAEIAEALGTTRGTVYAVLHRLRNYGVDVVPRRSDCKAGDQFFHWQGQTGARSRS
jgi:hypothetical protein